MIKEQEAELEKLKTYLEYAKKDDLDKFILDVKTAETILSMLKEKDKEINSQNGTINALKCALKERTEERDRKDDIITKLNKQIDLMADYMLSGLEDIAFNNICKQGYCAHELKDNRPTKCRKCKECIKQKFAGEK